jgi:hypothetical protein
MEERHETFFQCSRGKVRVLLGVRTQKNIVESSSAENLKELSEPERDHISGSVPPPAQPVNHQRAGSVPLDISSQQPPKPEYTESYKLALDSIQTNLHTKVDSSLAKRHK